MSEFLTDNHASEQAPRLEEQEIQVRDFAYEYLHTKPVPTFEPELPPSSSEIPPHPLRSNPLPPSISHYGPGIYHYVDRSITLTTPTGEHITWVPRGQVVPPVKASSSTPVKKRKRKRDSLARKWRRVKKLLMLSVNGEDKKKGMGVEVHVTGRRASAGFLRRIKSVFRRSNGVEKRSESNSTEDNEQERKKEDEEECRLCRADETGQSHENHHVSPPSSQFSNRNGEPLNPLAGRTSQFERFVNERAEGLMNNSFVGTPSPESSGVPSLESLEDGNEREHEELPRVVNMESCMDLVTGEGEARNGDGELSTTEQVLAWPLNCCGRRTDSEQQIGGLCGVVEHDGSVNIQSEADDEELVNITFTPFDTSHNSSTSISRLPAQFSLPPNREQFDTMENISNLQLPSQKYPEAYTKLREEQEEAFYAKELPIPASTRSSSCDSSNIFQFASRATIKDALHKWSTQATNRSSACTDQELEVDRHAMEEAILKNTVVPVLRTTPFQELQQKIQEAMESPLFGMAIPRPNSAEIDRRRKEMNLRLQEPFTKSLASASSDFTSEPSLLVTIENLDIEEPQIEEKNVIVGSPFVDVHEEYVAHPSTSFPLPLAPIGYPALDSSATLSEFGFHPTVDTMPSSWKQRWEILDSSHSSDEGVIHGAFESASDAASTPLEEYSSLTLNDGIEHSEPMPIKKGNVGVCVDSIRRTASQMMFSRCRKIPGSFMDDESPTNPSMILPLFENILVPASSK